jgi:ribosomal protein S18 acetylase RimI-like enzyme
MAEDSNLAETLTFRPVMPEDEDFLFNLYSTTRRDELAAWGWNDAQKDAFLKLQFKAQQYSYATMYTPEDSRLIMLDNKPIGRMIVVRSDEEIRLADIAILPEYFNDGIGTFLIKHLLTEAAQAAKPVGLRVYKSNERAVRFYERLGFIVAGEDELAFSMQHPVNA